MNKRSILRKILREPASGEAVDDLVAGVLASPTTGEDFLAEAVRKSGGDDSVEVTALAAKRALAALVKAYKDAGRPVPSDVLDGLAGDSSDDEEDDGPPAGDFTTYDARRAIEEEDAKGKNLKRKAKRGDAGWSDEEADRAIQHYQGQGLSGLSKSEADSLLDAIRDVMPEWAADRVLKEHPDWTREQARAHAYTSDPSLYRREQERQEERIAKADADLRERAARADRELRSLVASIRKADASMTEPQAWKAALDRRPDLYVPAPAQRFDPADAVIAKAERDVANTKFQRLADELRTRDSSLSAAQAYARAMQLHPEWYQG